jgi:predicted GNAT family acetyltransferase
MARVTDAPERSRFEIELDGEVVGFAQYRRRPGVIAFIHTEIEPGHEGEGLGGELVGAALDAARAEGAQVLPFCPFVRSFIDRHREYADLVPADRRDEFELGDG